MHLIIGNFHQDDFSCIAQLKPTAETMSRIKNEYKGQMWDISIIKKKLQENLENKVGQSDSLILGQILIKLILETSNLTSLILRRNAW